MGKTLAVQGREVTQDDIRLIKQLIPDNSALHRTQLSKELSLLWNWRATKGQINDMPCRTLLLKLEGKWPRYVVRNLKLAMSEIISGTGSMIWMGYREDIQWSAGGF